MFLLLPLVSVDGLCNLRRYTFFNFPHIYLYMCDELSSKTVECLFFSFFLFGNKVRANRHFIRHLRFYFYLSEICAICRTLFPLIPNFPKSPFSFIFSFFLSQLYYVFFFINFRKFYLIVSKKKRTIAKIDRK